MGLGHHYSLLKNNDRMVRYKNGLATNGLGGYFFGVEPFGFAGSNDFTFLAYLKINIQGEFIIVAQNTEFANGAGRFEITSRGLIVGVTRYGGSEDDIIVGDHGLCVRRQSGITSVFRVVNGTLSSVTGMSPPTVSSSIITMICNSPSQPITPDAELIAIQYKDSALSDAYIIAHLQNYYLLNNSDRNYLYYQKTTGDTDGGAYPAKMTSDTLPSPFVISYSWQATNEWAWRSFDGVWNTRATLRNTAGTSSAGAWLKVDLGINNAKAVDAYHFRSWAGQGLNSFTISASNNDLDWTDLYTGNGVNSDAVIQVYTWTNTTNYRYYRITCNSGYSATQWTHYQSILIDRKKEWRPGYGFFKQYALTFPS